MVKRLSGLQRQVLSLYRSSLRAARAKPGASGDSLAAMARSEIEKHRDIDRKDILLIEHLIRKGRRQLELLSSASVTGVMHLQPQAGNSSGGSGNASSGGSGSGSGGGSSGAAPPNA
ncbi:heat repeat [Chlorella sorokiniana]|uniref:Heat repeat n=1 Tax=Chlorella sorokiniana TaxID=3076 RepID=A0A2P6THT2_CHLSO|nr:heat repeat [Chlorella sorokiniana]|eukprot:PRW33837.1 heat repeat [Chlorella sorokiniana]